MMVRGTEYVAENEQMISDEQHLTYMYMFSIAGLTREYVKQPYKH